MNGLEDDLVEIGRIEACNTIPLSGRDLKQTSTDIRQLVVDQGWTSRIMASTLN